MNTGGTTKASQGCNERTGSTRPNYSERISYLTILCYQLDTVSGKTENIDRSIIHPGMALGQMGAFMKRVDGDGKRHGGMGERDGSLPGLAIGPVRISNRNRR